MNWCFKDVKKKHFTKCRFCTNVDFAQKYNLNIKLWGLEKVLKNLRNWTVIYLNS